MASRPLLLLPVVAFMAPGLGLSQNAPPLDPRVLEALRIIRPEGIRAHLEFLADDALEGRHTGSRGYELAAKYMRAQFAALGLKGGAKDGGYFQPVSLRQTDVDPATSSMVLEMSGLQKRLSYNKDFLLFDTHASADGSITAPVVFAGYGISAPQFHYDDYAGIDVKGKVVAVLTFEAPDSFPATERAYYMDSDVKREIAAAHGAVGIIGIITPELEQQLPWDDLLREVKIGSNSLRLLDRPNHVFGLDEQIKVAAILNRSGTDALFAGEEPTLKEIFDRTKAGKPGAFSFKKTVSIQYHARHTPVNSMNVVAILPGSDAALRNEYVVFTAHLDHLGIGPTVDGDNIYNGALDNAAGSSILLEVARFFASLPSTPKRSVAFVALTGEEEGLLGSVAFAHNSPLPGPVVANINVDGGAFIVPTKDVVAFGEEHSSLGPLARRAAAQLDLELSPDPQPEQGFFVRSDQYSFVQVGIPVLQLDLGYKSAQPGVDPLAEMKKWQATIYHSPKDDASQPIHYESSARFARFAALLTYFAANSPQRPTWNPNDFFSKKFCKPGGMLCPQ
jgi:Peptidase family M28/PA domain